MKQICNPYLPLCEYIPDGEPHVFGGRLYLYGSHDRENGDEFCELDYVCYSADACDLTEWRYEGVIYRKDQDPDNPDGSLCFMRRMLYGTGWKVLSLLLPEIL